MSRLARRTLLAAPLGLAVRALGGPPETPAGSFRLPLRSRVEAFRGSGVWQEVRFERDFPVRRTAAILCDMWDKHWCRGANERVGLLVKRMAPFVEELRNRGVQIIHAPSETMDFYKDLPQRQRLMSVAKVTPVQNRTDLTEPKLPIDDSDGGCDTDDKQYKAWSREHAGIRIAPEDGISDNGAEVYSFLRERGLENLLVMGVHANMCILNRTFAIRQMTRWGVPCVLVRDMTDAMYDPKDPPRVAHEQGTELVIEHIEKYWCPSALSGEVVQALRRVKTS